MSDIVVVGGGGHAKVVIGIFKRISECKIIGYTDISDKGTILGVSYLGSDQILRKIINERSNISAALGIGYLTISSKRKILAKYLQSLGYNLPMLLSPSAMINDQVNIERGSVVFDGAVINPGSRIGEFVIINTNSTIEHDVKIGNYVHIGPGAIICGGAVISDNSVVGAGATVIQNISIGESCIIGAGSTVITDILEPGIYVGSPARKIK
jgi:sugar O-acyltransferase (sialic acid O-acetyltransferase NeuD family)